MSESGNGAALTKVPRITAENVAGPKPKAKPRIKREPVRYSQSYNLCPRLPGLKGWLDLCRARNAWVLRNGDLRIVSETKSSFWIGEQVGWMIELIVIQPGKKQRRFDLQALIGDIEAAERRSKRRKEIKRPQPLLEQMAASELVVLDQASFQAPVNGNGHPVNGEGQAPGGWRRLLFPWRWFG